MKKKYILLIYLFTYFIKFGYSQEVDTVYFSIDMRKYNERAYTELKNNTFEFGILKLDIRDLELISIPVFKTSPKRETVNDSIKYSVLFKDNSSYQCVLSYIHNPWKNKIQLFEIYYIADFWQKDTFMANPFGFPYGTLSYFDFSSGKKLGNSLLEYKQKKPGIFIFMIENINGLWAIKENRIVRLRYDLFLGVREVELNSWLYCFWGFEFNCQRYKFKKVYINAEIIR